MGLTRAKSRNILRSRQNQNIRRTHWLNEIWACKWDGERFYKKGRHFEIHYCYIYLNYRVLIYKPQHPEFFKNYSFHDSFFQWMAHHKTSNPNKSYTVWDVTSPYTMINKMSYYFLQVGLTKGEKILIPKNVLSQMAVLN